jgi:hypothetical protein
MTTLTWLAREDAVENQRAGGPGVVVHTYNTSYSGVMGRRIKVQGWPWQKCETLSEN